MVGWKILSMPIGRWSPKGVWKSNFRVSDFCKSQSPLQPLLSHNITTITLSPLSQPPKSQKHHDHHMPTTKISPLSQYHHHHNITTITISSLSQPPLSQHHHHTITTITTTTITTTTITLTSITISPLSQYHHYQHITTITISPPSQSPLSQFHHFHNHHYHTHLYHNHHYHNITTITLSPLSQPPLSQPRPSQCHNHHHQNFTTITTTTITTTIITITTITTTTITISPLSQYHHYRNHQNHKSTTITICPLPQYHHYHNHHNHNHHYHNITTITITIITTTIIKESRTKASLSYLPLSDFEGSLAPKLHLHICQFQILREVSHEMHFWKLADARNVVFCRTKRALNYGWGRSVVARRFRNGLGYARIMVGSAPPWNWQFRRRLAQLELSKFAGSLARKLRFHIFSFQILREVSHESFVFTSSTFKSGTKASFSHLPLSLLQGSLARKLRWRRDPVLELQFLTPLRRSSRVFSYSVSADRTVMAASRLLGAAAVCVILLSFAAGHRKSYWSGCIKVAIVICQQIFSILALLIFVLKFLLKSASKWSFFLCFGAESLFWSCNFGIIMPKCLCM